MSADQHESPASSAQDVAMSEHSGLDGQATSAPIAQQSSDQIITASPAAASSTTASTTAQAQILNKQVEPSSTGRPASPRAPSRNATSTTSGSGAQTALFTGQATWPDGTPLPHSHLPPGAIIPPAPHGSPTRVYINQKVTPWLLEGVKYLAVNEPEKPLKWLGEYLIRMSEEVEGA